MERAIKRQDVGGGDLKTRELGREQLVFPSPISLSLSTALLSPSFLPVYAVFVSHVAGSLCSLALHWRSHHRG